MSEQLSLLDQSLARDQDPGQTLTERIPPEETQGPRSSARPLSKLKPPVRRRDPVSSREAAKRIAPKLSGQLLDVLGVIVLAGEAGASNREIQLAVCDGDNPGHPAWNKVPTRTKQLWDEGVIERMSDAETGDWLVREHPTGKQGFLVYRVKGPQ